jgi:hypothetical protein
MKEKELTESVFTKATQRKGKLLVKKRGVTKSVD